jgi:hypothetical protein
MEATVTAAGHLIKARVAAAVLVRREETEQVLVGAMEGLEQHHLSPGPQ